MGTRGNGDTGIWGHRDMVTRGHGDTGTWEMVTRGHGDMRIWGHGAMRTWGHVDMGTQGHGNMGTRVTGTRGHGVPLDYHYAFEISWYAFRYPFNHNCSCLFNNSIYYLNVIIISDGCSDGLANNIKNNLFSDAAPYH